MLLETMQLNNVRSVALCGAGGKTTLLYALAEEARLQNRSVILTTSTHILQPDNSDTLHFYPQNEIDSYASVCISGRIAAIGTPCEQKKITGIDPMTVDAAMSAADFFVYEADGSKCLPVKCHSNTEPVVWFGTDAVICVFGLSALGRSAQDVCHRHTLDPLFSAMPQKLLDSDDFVRLALECRQKAGYPHRFLLCLNQCDSSELLSQAREIADGLAVHGIRCYATCFLGQVPEITAL